jgi:Uma2 family endonuclease
VWAQYRRARLSVVPRTRYKFRLDDLMRSCHVGGGATDIPTDRAYISDPMNAAAQSLTAPNWPRRHLIDVTQYYKMAEVGLLAPDSRVELIEGVIVDMAPIGIRHASMVDTLAETLIQKLAGQATVRVQGPVRLSQRTEPQPDLSILKKQPNNYRDAPPTAADVLLIIEVSDSTLKFDLTDKAGLYARHGIPELWVVDVDQNELHVFRVLSQDGYGQRVVFRVPEVVSAELLPIANIDLATLFS